MADRVKFSVLATPIETLTDENLQTHDIVASEVKRTLVGSGESINLTDYSNTADAQGYKDATVNYRSASHSAGGTQLTTLIPDFLFIKNTGYKYSSGTALGQQTTDCVLVAIKIAATATPFGNGGWCDAQTNPAPEDHYIELAWLKPNQAVVLPLGAGSLSITQFGSNSYDFTPLNTLGTLNYDQGNISIVVRTYQSNGTSATSPNAVEFLAVT